MLSTFNQDVLSCGCNEFDNLQTRVKKEKGKVKRKKQKSKGNLGRNVGIIGRQSLAITSYTSEYAGYVGCIRSL